MRDAGLQGIERVFIDRGVEHSDVAKRARLLFKSEQIEIVDGEPWPEKKGELSAKDFDRSKRNIFITEFKGQFFKRCPGARPGLTCCNYFVLNLGVQCNMNCSYCYLQSFVNTPVMKVYANIDKALNELADIGRDLKHQALRVGTGETIDSLSLDELTMYSARLIEFFRDYPNWKLEFKTKSSRVDQFIDVSHANNVIVSFSINPQTIIEAEEHGTSGLYERLEAARKARDKGFQVAFHIDPMIWHPEWRESYRELVARIAAQFAPQDINVISVGALRFQPEQRHMMRERFGLTSLVTQAETFVSHDGKYRYDQKLREEMLKFVVDEFRARSPDYKIFLCMETPEVWLSSMQATPKKVGNIDVLFDHHVTHKFSEKIAAKEITETR